jgi:hypothetical protein
MSGETLDYEKHPSLQLGQYCQVHEEGNPHNSQIVQTKGVIYLGPSGNLQGKFKFMALNSGKKIVRRSWDVIPMPDLVIDRVNALGCDQPQQMTFTHRHGRLISDIEIPGVDAEEENDDHLPGVVPVIADDIEIPGVYVEGTETQDAVPAPQVDIVKLLPLPQPPVRARTDTRTNPSAQRATQLRSVLAHVYAVSIQNQITTTVP